MTPKQRTLAAIRCQEVDRTPWVPFVGCHAAQLVDVPADRYLQSAELIVAGITRAIERYKPDGIPVSFDLQIEAETFGCKLVWAAQNPPSVASHPLTGGKTLADLAVPPPDAGRLGVSLEAARQLRRAHPDIALYGLVTGPFTLALHLLGTDIFMKMFDDPAYVRELMAFCGRACTAVSGYYIDAGCDVVAVVDPMTSQIGPDQFRQFVAADVAAAFEHIRRRGAASSFFVCGHAQQNIEAMCECGPDNVSVDENIPLEFVRDVCLPRGVSFGGNMKLTTVLLLGNVDSARRNAAECLKIGGQRGFVLSPGCDLPYATPPANIEAVRDVAADPYQAQVAMALDAPAACDLLDMSDYGQSDRVIVDIITLDSEACAPCQYMVEAVRRIAPEFEGVVTWREHKIKQSDSLQFMTSLMVRNIPTICIDGEIRFVSRIPSRDELVAAIQQRICQKLRVRIRSRKAALAVLGDGGESTRRLKENVERAIKELGFDVECRLVTDEKAIASYGLVKAQLPAAVLTRYQVKSTGEVPDVAIIKEWIKDLH